MLLGIVSGLAAIYGLGSLMRPSLQSKLLEVLLRLSCEKGTVNARGPKLAAQGKAPNAVPSKRMRKRYTVTMREVNGCGVYIIAPRDATSNQHIYYLHGGEYIYGFFPQHWHFISRLVDALGCTVTAPDYPLAPAGHVDNVFALVLPLYRELVSQVGAANLTIMGDSSGGGMSLALAERLRDEGDPQPAHLILLSPWLDVTMTNLAIEAVDRVDPLLGVPGLMTAGKMYAGDTNPAHPLVSPIYGDIAGLAPIALFVGAHDVLVADCRKFKGMAQARGIPLDYYEYEGMIHGWMFLGFLPEAREAFNEVVESVKGS